MPRLQTISKYCVSWRSADNRAVASSAKVGRDLLGPLVGRVHRVSPADGVVVERSLCSKVVDMLDQVLRCHQIGRLSGCQFVQGAVQRAVRRGAVVADDVIDEG